MTITGTILYLTPRPISRTGVRSARLTVAEGPTEHHLLIAWSDGCDGFDVLVKGAYVELDVVEGQPRGIVRRAVVAKREINLNGHQVTVEQDTLF